MRRGPRGATRVGVGGEGVRRAEAGRGLAGDVREAGLSAPARQAVEHCRQAVERILAEGRTVYGVNTGVGRLADVKLDPADLGQFQRNLLLSHAAGVGPAMPEPEARLMLLLRISTLARGYSGVSPATLDALTALFNAGITPVVPEQGSVGASGDLAPLAHLAWSCWAKAKPGTRAAACRPARPCGPRGAG